jgi:hypothetical protein
MAEACRCRQPGFSSLNVRAGGPGSLREPQVLLAESQTVRSTERRALSYLGRAVPVQKSLLELSSERYAASAVQQWPVTKGRRPVPERGTPVNRGN